jgi:hypothetical protein
MDPTTLIITALETGAATAAQATASQAIKDSYQGLKVLLQRKFTGRSEAELALTKHTDEPEEWTERLKTILSETASDQDTTILQAARHLLSLTHPQQRAMGKFNLQFNGDVQGVVNNDSGQVTLNFGVPPKDR